MVEECFWLPRCYLKSQTQINEISQNDTKWVTVIQPKTAENKGIVQLLIICIGF